MRRLILCIVAVAAAGPLAASSTAAETIPVSPIEPGQFFNGLVNGYSGRAIIRMACFGPIRPGQLGHPMAGQIVSVSGPLGNGPGSVSGIGFTGLANSIDATLFFATPPGPTPPTGVELALFDDYNAPAPISTKLEFPCAGSGTVVFDPVMGGETARAATVSVFFVGQP